MNRKGFTLLELLVVVVIIGILAAIALPQYRRAVGKAELAQVINVVKVISNAQDRFYLVNGTYTTNLSRLDVDIPLNNDINCKIFTTAFWCYNKNFAIAHYYSFSRSDSPSTTECYSRTKGMGNACKDFLKKGYMGQSINAACDEIGGKPCWEVVEIMPM